MSVWKRRGLRLRRYLHLATQWLPFGMGVKRWLLVLVVGVTLLSLGFSLLLREFYPLPRIFYYVTLQFMPRGTRATLFILVGLTAVGIGLVGASRSLLKPFVDVDADTLVRAIQHYRRRERGPKIVVVGGGHGLSTLLRGLKQYTSNVTAIVTVADDGGSSGRLRRALGVLPPGDFRNCIAALADDEALMTHLFQYRFGSGSGLNGHSFGNLFITAMAEVTGSFERAILESGRVLAVRGQVLPSTLENVTLTADIAQEERSVSTTPPRDRGNGTLSRVTGESRIPLAEGAIRRVYLDPDDAQAYPGAVRALLNADMIVAGPGSLYTSVLPNLLVPSIADAVGASTACKIYVCNVATQQGETDGYVVGDHVAALERHVGRSLFPVVVANETMVPDELSLGKNADFELVELGTPFDVAYRVITADLIDRSHPWRHDGQKLARLLLEYLESEEVH